MSVLLIWTVLSGRTVGEGSREIWAYMQSILPQQFIISNSTQGYRDMNATELAGLKQHMAHCHERRKAEKQAVVINGDGQTDSKQARLPAGETPATSSSPPIGATANGSKRNVQEIIEISDGEDDEAAPPAPKRQRIMPGAPMALDKVNRILPAARDVHLLDVRPINGVKRTCGHHDEPSYNRADDGRSSFKRTRFNHDTAQPSKLPLPAGKVKTAEYLSAGSSVQGPSNTRAQRNRNYYGAIDESVPRSKVRPTDNMNGISRAYREVPFNPRQPGPRVVTPHTSAQHVQHQSNIIDDGRNSLYSEPNSHPYTPKLSQTVSRKFSPLINASQLHGVDPLASPDQINNSRRTLPDSDLPDPAILKTNRSDNQLSIFQADQVRASGSQASISLGLDKTNLASTLLNSAVSPKQTATPVVEPLDYANLVEAAIPSNVETSTVLSTAPGTRELRVDFETVVEESAASASKSTATLPREPQGGEIAGTTAAVPEESDQLTTNVIAPSSSAVPIELVSTTTRVSSGLSSPVSEQALANLAQEAASRASSSHSAEGLSEELSDVEAPRSPSPTPSELDIAASVADKTYNAPALDEGLAAGSAPPQPAADDVVEEARSLPQAPS